jgi:hypothetical protein
MLTTVKGYYDQGQIILNEKPPIEKKTDVIVTFLTDEKSVATSSKRILGALKGKITLPDNFDDQLEDFNEA